MNENGQRMLELCCHHCLCVNNVFFKTKHHHRVSWIRPRSNNWHQRDYVLTRRTVLSCIKLNAAFTVHGCDTNHSLVYSKLKLQSKKTYHIKTVKNCKQTLHERQKDTPCTETGGVCNYAWEVSSRLPCRKRLVHRRGRYNKTWETQA